MNGPGFLLPLPLPDEILNGWRGRVASLNLLPTAHAVKYFLRRATSPNLHHYPDSQSFLRNAATALSMSPIDLAARHTLIPFLDATVPIAVAVERSSANQDNTYRQGFLFRVHGKRAAYCPRCVADDVDAFGFSYWRRSHQLPGAIQCPHHATPLFGAMTVDAFEQCPHMLTESKLLHPPELFDENSSAITDRFNKLANAILVRAPQIGRVKASSILGKRVRASGFSVSPHGKSGFLSTHILRTLPLQWLSDAMPAIEWEIDKFISSVDAIGSPRSSRYSIAALCLVTAVLYSNVDEAIQDLFHCDQPECVSLGNPPLDAQFNSAARGTSLTSTPSRQQSNHANNGLPSVSALFEGQAKSTLDALALFLKGGSWQQACIDANAGRESFESLIRLGWLRFAENAGIRKLADLKT